jgi:NADH-quinone oxidoreductase subunit E
MTTTPQSPPLATRRFESVCRILDAHGRDPNRLIPILQAVQEEYRYLPEEVMVYVATSLGLPPARVYGVATFYAHFALEPKGKHVIRLCDGTACHVKGSLPILEAIRGKLGLTEVKKTTPDMLFTVETVSCLGACGLAPVVVINDQVHGQMTPPAALALVEDIMRKEGAL